jgi:hypothetical protein
MELGRERDETGAGPYDQPARSETLLLCSDLLAVQLRAANLFRVKGPGLLQASIENAQRRRRLVREGPLRP